MEEVPYVGTKENWLNEYWEQFLLDSGIRKWMSQEISDMAHARTFSS